MYSTYILYQNQHKFDAVEVIFPSVDTICQKAITSIFDKLKVHKYLINLN